MSKCRKCHLRETKFAKFPGGACPQTPLEARAVGARLSAFGANRASLFLLKRGWNVCRLCLWGEGVDVCVWRGGGGWLGWGTARNSLKILQVTTIS